VSRLANRWCCATIARICSSTPVTMVRQLLHHRIEPIGERALDPNLIAHAATSASACSCCREINSSVTD
jgi:hypothetical protein